MDFRKAKKEASILRKLYWWCFSRFDRYRQRNVGMSILHQLNVSQCRRRQVLAQRMRGPTHALEQLRANGYCFLEPSEIPDVTDAINWINAWNASFEEKNSSEINDCLKSSGFYFNKKRFSLSDLYSNGPSPPMRLALNETVLGIVAEYYGYIPLAGIHARANYFTSQKCDSLKRKKTSYPHLDWRDNTLLRMYVNPIDGDEMQGVLHVLNAEDSSQLRSKVNYRYQIRRTSHHLGKNNGLFLSGELVDQFIPRERWQSLRGKAGTIAIVDTARCFHFASQNASTQPGKRLNLIVNYVRPCALALEPAITAGKLTASELSGMSELQRLAFAQQ